MRKVIFGLSFVLCLSSCVSVEKHNLHIASLHATVSLQDDVDKAYQQLKKHHPKLYQYTSKEVLDFKFDSLKKTIKTPLNSRSFYKKIAPVIAQVRQGHISVGPPNKWFSKKEIKLKRKEKFELRDFDFEFLEGKLWVKKTGIKDTVYVGNEVVKFNGESVSELIKKYRTFIASDGFNNTYYNTALGRHFKGLYYRDKGYLDSLKITFKNKDSVFSKQFKRIAKQTSKDTVLVKKKPALILTKSKKKELKLKAKQQRKYNKNHGYVSSKEHYNRNLSFIGKDSTIAYMHIRSFTNGRFKTFYENSFKALELNNTQDLVIDLRNNGGGRLSEISKLYSYLTDQDYQFIKASETNSRLPFLKAYMSNATSNGFKTVFALFAPFVAVHNLMHTKKVDGKLYYKFKQYKMAKANPLQFKGNVYVLINGSSFSASSILSTQLQANKRAFFVGEETGGAYNGTVAGIFKYYQLPTSKVKMRIGLMQIETPFIQNPDGYGVKPDVVIIPTVLDRKENKDPELEWILKDIENKEK